MTRIPPTGPETRSSERIRRARLLSCADRRDLVAAFFSKATPGATGGLGLGTAIADFLSWEISSGRIRDVGGSPWWSAVNGLLVLDMTDASLPGPAPFGHRGAAGWAEFLDGVSAGTTRAQRLLWSAHQDSIEAAAEMCSGLLALEPEPEREFARVALAVVERAARMDIATDGPVLGQMTRSYFPGGYPIDDRSVAKLCSELAELRSSATPGSAQGLR